jgi:hypothetical protein
MEISLDSIADIIQIIGIYEVHVSDFFKTVFYFFRQYNRHHPVDWGLRGMSLTSSKQAFISLDSTTDIIQFMSVYEVCLWLLQNNVLFLYSELRTQNNLVIQHGN